MIKIYLSFAYFLLLVFDDDENIPFLCLSFATKIKKYLSFAYLSLLASPNSNFRRWTKIHLSITYFSKVQTLATNKKNHHSTISPSHLNKNTKTSVRTNTKQTDTFSSKLNRNIPPLPSFLLQLFKLSRQTLPNHHHLLLLPSTLSRTKSSKNQQTPPLTFQIKPLSPSPLSPRESKR